MKPARSPLFRAAGFTMLELIGVMAVIAILSAVIVPNGLRALDRAAISAEATPTLSEIRRPYMMPESMSRPWSSVPITNSWPVIEREPGGSRPSMMSIWLRS